MIEKVVKVLINYEDYEFKMRIFEILDNSKINLQVSIENDFEKVKNQIIAKQFDIIFIDYKYYKELLNTGIEYFDDGDLIIVIISDSSRSEKIFQMSLKNTPDIISADNDDLFTVKRIIRNAINKYKIIYEKNSTIQQLREMEQKYNLFIEKSKDIPFFINKHGIVTYIGPQVDNYGYRIADFLGKPFTEFVYKEDREKIYKDFIDNFEAKKETTDIFRVDTPKKGIVWFESKSRILFDHNDDFLLGIGIIRDVTDRIDFKNKFEFNESKYKKIFENATDAILIMQDDIFIECNAKSVELFGAKNSNDIVGKTPVDFSPVYQDDNKKSKEWATKYITDSYNGRDSVFDWKHLTLDGNVVDCKVSLSKFSHNNKDYLFAIVRKK